MLSSRTITFLSTLFSTLTLIFIIVFVPLFFTYVQQINTSMLSQLYKCQVGSNDIWKEVAQLGRRLRIRRRSGRYAVQLAGQDISCCSCQQGKPGPPGKQGRLGVDGKDGILGANGLNGRPGQYVYWNPSNENSCQKCPPAMTGPPGFPGMKGPRGAVGLHGQLGTNGTPGQSGPPGPAGSRGPPGQSGAQGPQGDPGRVLNGALPGPSGPPGPMGPRGRMGTPGSDGATGVEGYIGERGEQGERGASGMRGVLGPLGPRGSQAPRGTCNRCPARQSASEEKTYEPYEPSPPSVAPPLQPPYETKPDVGYDIPTVDVPRIYSNSPVQGDGSRPQGYSIFTSSPDRMLEYRRKEQRPNKQSTLLGKWSQQDGHSLLKQLNQPKGSPGRLEEPRAGNVEAEARGPNTDRQDSSAAGTRLQRPVRGDVAGTGTRRQETVQENASKMGTGRNETVQKDNSWTGGKIQQQTGADSSEKEARKEGAVRGGDVVVDAKIQETAEIDGSLQTKHNNRVGESSEQHESLEGHHRHQQQKLELESAIRAAEMFAANRQSQVIKTTPEQAFVDPYNTRKIISWQQTEQYSLTDRTRPLSPPPSPHQYG